MPAKTRRIPSYRHFKPRNLAVVRIEGCDHYLGPHGSAESHERYLRLIAEWQQGQTAAGTIRTVGAPTPALTINELVLRYWRHALQHYRKHGELTGYHHAIRSALRYLRQLYGSTAAKEFGPLALKAVRQAMIEAGLTRGYINAHVDRIRRAFRWGVSEEVVPVSVVQALETVTGLEKGRSAARETEPVKPVIQADIDAALPFMPAPVAAMVKLQLACAARPGEICLLRPCDVTFGADGLWIYRPVKHKTEHEGKARVIVIGPAAQKVLQPYLDRDPQAYCFSPAETVEARNAKRRSERKTPITPSQARRRPKTNPRRRAGARYTSSSYRTAVARACKKANVPVWRPNQLRHTRATLIREKFGLEGAQVVLGHADPKMSERYAEQSLELAKKVMQAIG
jgi:integrase